MSADVFELTLAGVVLVALLWFVWWRGKSK
jgi:LPXTG-motif cell wall-anchored protein